MGVVSLTRVRALDVHLQAVVCAALSFLKRIREHGEQDGCTDCTYEQ